MPTQLSKAAWISSANRKSKLGEKTMGKADGTMCNMKRKSGLES